MNAGDVRGKLDVLAANHQQLNWLRALSAFEFAGDARNLDSALHRLQTSIQALLDVAGYVVAGLNLPAPQHCADLIRTLAAAGLIDGQAAENYERMVAFRNRVVHLYNRVDPTMVYEILQKHLPDLEELLRTLLGIIDQHPDSPPAGAGVY